MKIGILTLSLHTNYGGILQAYALQTFLKRRGHDVTLIGNVWWDLRRSPLKRAYWKYLIRSHYTRAFVRKYIQNTHVADLNRAAELNLDAIVVGSDQVWRPMYFGDIKNAFLYFARDWKVKKIAYAASFGSELWEYTPEQTELCGELIRHFDAVSVREESARLLCNKYLHAEAELLPDPTLLLRVDDYLELIKGAKFFQGGSVLCTYFLDRNDDKARLEKIVADEYGISAVVELGAPTDDKSKPLLQRIQYPVERWIQGIYTAQVVITDSFHACVFSILFHKPFIVYGNATRGMARFYSLLEQFDLQDRLVVSSGQYKAGSFRPIDWGKVDARLGEMNNAANAFWKKVAV